MSKKSEIFIITGTPGSGKSTTAKRLLQRYEFGLHIPIDDLREWVVSGIAHPLPEWTDETTRQFALAHKATAKLADLYAKSGFSVAVDQVIYPHDVQTYYENQLSEHTVHKVFLQPKVEVSLERNSSRTSKEFDPSFLIEPIQRMHKSLGDAIRKEKDWIIVDSSDLTLEETVAEIFLQIDKRQEQDQ